jgi:hypothetical protein
MKITATLLMTAIFTLTHAEANDIRVLVSNAAGARVHDPAVGAGYVVLPAPHADLNVLWDATTQTFSGGFMTDSNANGGGAVVQFGPEDAIAYLPSTGQRQRTSTGTQYDFQGALGDTYWVFPSSSSSSNGAFSLYLGFSAYGVPNDGTFTGSGASTIGRIRWTVHSVENLSTPSATAFYGYSISAGNVNMQLTLDLPKPRDGLAGRWPQPFEPAFQGSGNVPDHVSGAGHVGGDGPGGEQSDPGLFWGGELGDSRGRAAADRIRRMEVGQLFVCASRGSGGERPWGGSGRGRGE